MSKKKSSIIFFFLIGLLATVLLEFVSCTYDKEERDVQQIADTGYPTEIGNIISNKCATAGCHNNQSKAGAGGLSLVTWESMFEGGKGGSTVIPYRPDYSTLLYYTNTDTTKGISLQPTMPYNAPPLTTHEYEMLKNWIKNGAPNKSGFVKFSDYKNKAKLYVCNRGCDVVTVMDAETGIAMRYVDVGKMVEIEVPSVVKVSPDKLHWYVAFNNGTLLQKFRVSDNLLMGELDIGLGMWSSMSFSTDSKKAFVTDAQYNGKIVYVDLENMSLIASYTTGLKYPTQTCVNVAGTTLYVTAGEGNYINKIDITNPLMPVVTKVSLETGVAPTDNKTLNPYTIILSADEKSYYVSCQKSAELRILQTSTDSLLTTIAVGSNPAKMYVSNTTPYLFLSCMGAPGSVKLSSIYVINYQTNTYVTDVYAGHESRGIVMDETAKKLYVANRNASAGGPAAHHTAVCAGKNGYITVIDVSTLKLVEGFKKELSVDPYDLDLVR